MRMIRRQSPARLRLLALLMALGVFAGCGPGAGPAGPAPTAPALRPPESGPTKPLKVVATFSILGDLVRNVAGDEVELRTLVPPGGDAHTFEPSPADSVALAEADLVFENGLAFEGWLPDLFAASGSRARRVVVSEGVELIEAGAGEDDEHDKTDEHGEFDPHVWHDVGNAIIMVERIRDGLIAADPAHADAYRANADAYIARLKQLDASVVERVDTLPAERRRLVTTHDTFGYFARRYGFEIVGTALGASSTEVADPSAADIARLVDEIKATGVPAIFAENIESGSLMQRVAREAGVELAPTLYTDALGEAGGEGDTYLKMIRYNVEMIVEALGR